MSKHTPGPWEVRYGCVSDADEGFGIGSKVDPAFGTVAECWPCTTTLHKRQTLAANARLIAAAPDLLAELRHLVRLLEPLEQSGELQVPGLATLNGARAAIAEAEGME